MKRKLFSIALFISFAAITSIPGEVPPQDQRLEIVGDDALLRVDGILGRTYFFQQSRPGEELKEWDWLPIVRAGNGEQFSVLLNRSGDKKFFRLQYTDQLIPEGETAETADFDKDGLSNFAEISTHSTDPLKGDTDGDLLPDGFEVHYGLNPNTPEDSGTTFPGSDLTYLEAYQSGLSTRLSATLEDLDGDLILNDDDANPREFLIDWERAPAASYAVVDLNMEALSEFALPHGREPVRAILNDTGQISRERNENLDEKTPSYWNGEILPIIWANLGDFTEPGLTEPSTFSEWSLGFSNDGQIFHGHKLDGFNGVQGIQDVTVGWPTSENQPALYGSYPYEQRVKRLLQARFDHLVIDETVGSSSSITSGSFSLNTSGATPPRLSPFNLYSYAPNVTRTGRVLIERDGQFKINDDTIPADAVYGVTADPHDLDLIAVDAVTTSAGISTLRHRNGEWEEMPMPGIMDMNAKGVGITFPSHQIWRNGSAINLDEMLEDSGWQSFKVEQVNKPGHLLGSAQRVGSSDYLPVLLVPAVIEQYDFETEGTNDGVLTVTPADPRPDVDMQLVEAEVNASGQLEVRVTGTVRDQLSEVVEGQRISELRFSVNGEPVKTISLSFGAGEAPWTLADSRNTFDETILISDPKPGGYEIRAETDENAAGNTGWDRVAAGLTRENDPTAPQEAFSQLSVVFAQNPSSTTADTLIVFFGNRSAEAGDPVFTETAADSLEFSGILTLADQAITCTLRIKDFAESEGGAPGHVSADLRYTPAGGEEITVVTSLASNSSESLRFFPDGFQVNAERNSVKAMPDLGGSHGEDIQPLLMKVGIPEAIASQSGFRILVNGSPHALKKFNYGGGDSLYVVNNTADTHPKIFVPCIHALPPANFLPGCDLPGETIRWEMELGGQTYLLNGTLVLPSTKREEVAPPAAARLSAQAARGGWQRPGDTITFDDLVTAYKFIYTDELSQTLLRVYLQEGHEISLTDVLSDYKFSYLGRPGTKALIEIENDDDEIHPGIAAQYLWRGLTKALTIYSYRNAVAVALNDDSLEIDAITAYKAEVGPAAAEVGVAAAELYLSGIGIINEPLDWVLVVNDVAEGEYTSLAAALPFISRGLVTVSKGLRFESRAGVALGRLDVESFPALRDAMLTGKLETVGTVLDEFALSKFIGKLIAKDGSKINVPKREKGLKQAMKRRVPKPGDLFEAHHDLPWSERAWFAERGINVNNPAFGRWAHKNEHDVWHKGAGGGEFHQFWYDFMEEEATGPRKTVLDILAALEECRQRFPVTITE